MPLPCIAASVSTPFTSRNVWGPASVVTWVLCVKHADSVSAEYGSTNPDKEFLSVCIDQDTGVVVIPSELTIIYFELPNELYSAACCFDLRRVFVDSGFFSSLNIEIFIFCTDPVKISSNTFLFIYINYIMIILKF